MLCACFSCGLFLHDKAARAGLDENLEGLTCGNGPHTESMTTVVVSESHMLIMIRWYAHERTTVETAFEKADH